MFMSELLFYYRIWDPSVADVDLTVPKAVGTMRYSIVRKAPSRWVSD